MHGVWVMKRDGNGHGNERAGGFDDGTLNVLWHFGYVCRWLALRVFCECRRVLKRCGARDAESAKYFGTCCAAQQSLLRSCKFGVLTV
jgi:hypothetical protein